MDVFQGLSEDMIAQIAEITRTKDFAKGEYISRPSDTESDFIYFLKEGEVEVYESTAEGKKIIVDIMRPGDMFGYNHIFVTPQRGRQQFIKASNKATAFLVPTSDFLALLQRKPDIALRVICFLSAKLADAEHKLRDTALTNPETRLMQELERLYKKYGIEESEYRKITRKFTHEELANLVGTTRETISRLIPRLIKEGKVFTDKAGHFMLKKK